MMYIGVTYFVTDRSDETNSALFYIEEAFCCYLLPRIIFCRL
jgi:hypothetical protein